MTERAYRRVASLKTAADFRAYTAELGLDLACDDAILVGPESPLCQPFEVHGRLVGNRWATQPMEGWDGTETGGITEAVVRRWRRQAEGLIGQRVIVSVVNFDTPETGTLFRVTEDGLILEQDGQEFGVLWRLVTALDAAPPDAAVSAEG